MNEPVTNINPRFSDPDAVATPWDEARRVSKPPNCFRSQRAGLMAAPT